MPIKTTLKSRILDEKDKEILMILQHNGRESLTKIAKQVHLSIDSVNKRMKEMQRKGIYDSGIFINPRAIGFPLVTDIKIKLQNVTEKEKSEFIAHLKEHPAVIGLLAIMGNFDFTCVLISRSTDELDKTSTEIRQKFSHLIANWKSILVMRTHKFEYYDLR